MKDFAWKLFSKTGNIETYLLFKEIENDITFQNENDIAGGSLTSPSIPKQEL